MNITVLRPKSRWMPLSLSIIFLFLAVLAILVPALDAESPFERGEFEERHGRIKSVSNQDGDWYITLQNDDSYAMLGIAKDILSYSELEAALPVNAEVTLTVTQTSVPEYYVIGIKYGEIVVLNVADVTLRNSNNLIFVRTLIYSFAAILVVFAGIFFVFFMRAPKKAPLSAIEIFASSPLIFNAELKNSYSAFKRRSNIKRVFSLYIPLIIVGFSFLFVTLFSYLPASAFIGVAIFSMFLVVVFILLIIIFNNLQRAKKAIERFSKYYTYNIDGMDERTNNSFLNHYYDLDYSFTPNGIEAKGDVPTNSEFQKIVSYENLNLKAKIFFKTEENMITILLTTECPEETTDSGKEFIFFLNKELYYWLKHYDVQVEGMDEATRNIKELAQKHITLSLQFKTLFGLIY